MSIIMGHHVVHIFMYCVPAGFYGAVSAMDISTDGSRLICGYAKGLVSIIYEITLPPPSLYPSLPLPLPLPLPPSSPSLPLPPSPPQLTHWDLSSHKCLRFITDAHPPGFGVLRVRVRQHTERLHTHVIVCCISSVPGRSYYDSVQQHWRKPLRAEIQVS